ncbi:MAG: Sll0314/Alr1548 family TPR repeat-containing protein [Prochloraceae cyanobacterium]
MPQLKAIEKITLSIPLAIALVFGIQQSETLAGDPFRTKNVRPIGDKTEVAFDKLFRQGNYKGAKQDLLRATSIEANEPLAHALRAAIAYTEEDWETLRVYAQKTITSAQTLGSQDAMRGHLYLGVGHFLDGAYQFHKQGAVAALAKLQQVLYHFDRAENLDAKDPELNLLKGYMELMLAVNLPFSSPEEAIDRFADRAAPNFLVTRGIALAYRDLHQFDNALEFAEKSLQATPQNPELIYLKGQILRAKGIKNNDLALLQEALGYFDRALAKSHQLPDTILEPIQREHRNTIEQLERAQLK